MKPLERSGYIDVWILIQQSSDGKFYFNSSAVTASAYGGGFYTSASDAQHQQTLELLKGNKCEVFHLEFPLK